MERRTYNLQPTTYERQSTTHSHYLQSKCSHKKPGQQGRRPHKRGSDARDSWLAQNSKTNSNNATKSEMLGQNEWSSMKWNKCAQKSSSHPFLTIPFPQPLRTPYAEMTVGHKKSNEFDCSGGFALRFLCGPLGPVPPVQWSTRDWHMQLKMLANDSNCHDVKMRMGVFFWPWVCTVCIYPCVYTVAHLFALSYGAGSVLLFPGHFYFNLTSLCKCGDYEFLGSS